MVVGYGLLASLAKSISREYFVLSQEIMLASYYYTDKEIHLSYIYVIKT